MKIKLKNVNHMGHNLRDGDIWRNAEFQNLGTGAVTIRLYINNRPYRMVLEPGQFEIYTYRQSFGLDNPPEGSSVKIEYLEGCGFMIIWIDCPDKENVVERDFKKRKEAIEYVKHFGWLVQTDQ